MKQRLRKRSNGIGRNPGEGKNDAEGIREMKALGQNMAELLKKLSA